ncbi:hypothetical protein ALC57_11788 [Trachymyrmex cornetzi]|uniref:Uncharacterized protein n=1 Tax=Trachymyrmex cornetzi TaxID=471704 RepID=A0A151J1U5_9HYME|nr:hypothetical protein ALC57_11788 [Trachymyrmex cornetzi]
MRFFKKREKGKGEGGKARKGIHHRGQRCRIADTSRAYVTAIYSRAYYHRYCNGLPTTN